MLINFRNINQLSAVSYQPSVVSSQCLCQHHEIDLPLSKSESNRALMIMHYAKSQFTIDNEQLTIRQDSQILKLSNSDDTILLQKLLDKIQSAQSLLSVNLNPSTVELDCDNAGTVFRFLMTAVANLQSTIYNCKDAAYHVPTFLLTGSERMKSRPIGSLVEALRSLGTSIEYQGREGYPPVLVRGGRIVGGRVEVSAEQSSQFASSLLLASPTWKNGLELHLTGNISSLPYIDMTINMMRHCGIDVERNDRDITVKPGIYNIENIMIEPDWSAAAFWYEAFALSTVNGQQSTVLLKNLNKNSLQGDAVVMKMFENIGVETVSVDEGVILKISQGRKAARSQSQEVECNDLQPTHDFQLLTLDFKDCPDLFPAVIATCAGLQIDTAFTGLKNLSIKESDRKQAMINELKKINISFETIETSLYGDSDDTLIMRCPDNLSFFNEDNPMIFNNYGDHRIAMALSILSLKIGTIEMENTDVVSKSYPDFFEIINGDIIAKK